MKSRSTGKRLISMVMCIVLLMQTFPLVQFASAEEMTGDIPEMELSEDILSSDVFYLSAANAVLNENGGTYLLRIARGGDCTSQSGVTVRIADYTAKYGRDYTVSLWEEQEKANSPSNNQSLLEQLENSDYTESQFLTEEEYAEKAADNPELQAQTEQSIQDAIDFIENEVSSDSEADNTLKETPATVTGETADPVQAARALYTGIDSAPQEVTSNTDTLQQIQDVADIITKAVVGATLQVNFQPGEQEKHIAIKVKDNSRGDGDRYFYFMLSDPTGTTTNSAASSCAFTLVDDEEQTPSQVSFTQTTYDAADGGDTVSVEIVRKGASNTMASVHLSASSQKAVAGRDFSPVDTDVVFPIGISKRTIDIPVNSAYLTEDTGIALTLDEPADCTVAKGESEISLHASGEALLGAGAADEAYSLTDIVTGKEVDLKAPAVTGHSDHYDGSNSYKDDKWDLMWVDNCSGWDHFWGTSYNGLVAARWELTAGKGADIAGAQIDWDRSGDDATMSIAFTASTNRSDDWNKYNGKHAYKSSKGFDRHTENFFSNLQKPAYVDVFNSSGCEDCNHLYIYSIKPIYRPFVVEFDAEYDSSLEFLNADGTYSRWADATFLAMAGAVNNKNDQVIRYTAEGKNSISFMQSIGTGTVPYVALDYVNAVKDGKTKRFATFGATASDVYTTTLTSDWINSSTGYFAFEDNDVEGWTNQQAGVFGKRGRITLQPHFQYKDAVVKLNVPDNDIGYVVMSGTERQITESTSYTYHLGDIVKLQTVINDAYKGLYEPAGYLISYKQNPSDTKWIRQDLKISMDQDDGTAAYLDENQRLRYGYYEITPCYQKTNNVVTVRVKQSDMKFFDQSYGLFTMPEWSVKSTTVGDEAYRDYPLYPSPVFGRNYALTARLAASAPANGYLEWKEAGKSQTYVGETFFHASTLSPEDNIVTLSFRQSATGNSQAYISVSGQVTHPTYNMVTHQVSTAAQEPAEGALVNFGTGFGVAGKDGSFAIAPFRLPFDPKTAPSVRYTVSLNGEELLREVKLSGADAYTHTVRIYDTSGKTDEHGETPVTETDVTVFPQRLQEVPISVENGSILNDITVTPSATHSGSIITIESDEDMPVTATVPTNHTYTKIYADEFGTVTEEKNCPETVTGVDFLIRDAATHEVIQTFAAEKISDTTFRANLKMSTVLPGNELYIRVTTDRSHGVYTGSASDADINSTVYTNAYTGYTFIQKTTDPVPVLQQVTLPADMSFETLPLIGDTAMHFDFPFCSVGTIKTDTGYKLYIGLNVTHVADAIKGSHMSRYAADNGAYYGDIFQLKHPIQSFAEGLATCYQDAFGKNARALYEGNTASLGSPQWKLNVQLGVYFDFVYTTVTDPNTNSVNSACVFTGVGGYIGVSAGVKMAWYTLIPVVFIPAYFGIEIDAQVLGFFGAGTDTSKPQITFDEASHTRVDFNDKLGEFSASVKMAATVQVYVGVGLAGTIGLRGGGTFTAMALWEPSPWMDDWGCALTFTLGMWVDLFLFTIPLQYTFPSIKFGSFEQYASLNPQVEPVAPKASLRQPYSSANANWTANQPMVRAGFSPVSNQIIESNGYEHPDVQLLQLADGTVFMAFLDTDPAKGESERTVLKYATYQDGQWSSPVVVQNDSRGDFQPSICEMADGKVMLTWLSGDPAEPTPAEPENYLSGMEVFTAVVDTTTGTVSELTQLTDDDYYDYTPTCVYDPVTGDRLVYYVKTASDGSVEQMVNSFTNDCVVVYMLYSADEGRWLFDKYYDAEVASDADRQTLINNWHGQRFLASPIKELGLDVPNVTDFTAIAYNGLAVYAYTIDCDSNNDTSADKELFLQFCDLANHKTYYPIRLTRDSVCDTLPKLVRVGDDEGASTKLFWFRGEKDVAYLDISELVREGVNADGTIKESYLTTEDGEVRTLESLYSYAEIRSNAMKGETSMSDFDVVVDHDDIYLVWTQPHTITDDEGNQVQSREVYASALIQDSAASEYTEEVSADEVSGTIATGSSWSDPYQLTETYMFTDEPHAVISDKGNLMVLFNSYSQELTGEAENPVIISNFKLNASRMEPCGSIEVTGMTFSDDTPMSGDEVAVQMSVRNTGLTPAANGYTVKVTGPDGTVVTEITSDNKLLPGNTDTYDFTWTIPDTKDDLRLTAVSNETGMKNSSNYESDALIPSPYYAVTTPVVYQDSEGYHLLCTVTNEGNLPSQDGDTLRVLLVGPYGIDGQYEMDERIFAEVPLVSLAPGESRDIATALDVIPAAFGQYGFVDCYVAARGAEDKLLSQGEEIRIMAEKPLELLLNGESFPAAVELCMGDTMSFITSCVPQRLSDSMVVSFSTDNADVAVFEGTTLRALRPGTVTVTGTVMPYGLETPSITLTVLPTADHVHEWEKDFTVDTPATCTENGQKSIHCKTCGAMKDITVIPMLGHDWDAGTVTLAPTDKTAGVMTYTCLRCGATHAEEIPPITVSPATGDQALYTQQLLMVLSLAAILILSVKTVEKKKKS